MLKFIKFLQLAFAGIVGVCLCYDLVLHGIGIFYQKYVVMTTVQCIALEIALFIIYQLIKDDC